MVAMKTAEATRALLNLERVIAAVKGPQAHQTQFGKAIATLRMLARREGIPLAIVGGLAAIHHGYERLTKDIDIVVRSANLDVLIRVAPKYGIKVIWNDPDGWHKMQCEGVPIDVVPEGRLPRKDAPAAIPGPERLEVREGRSCRPRRLGRNEVGVLSRAGSCRRGAGDQSDAVGDAQESPQASRQSSRGLCAALRRVARSRGGREGTRERARWRQ